MDNTIGLDPVHPQPRQWVVDIEGKEISNLQVKKSVEIQAEGWENVRNTATAILAQCPSPKDRERRVTGLALGKIQSGKTLSYTALIALAVDNGYRITVVLAGTKNPLLEQNYMRLCRDLEATSRPDLTAFRNPQQAQDEEVIQNVLERGGHALIIVLKNRKRIEDVRKILARSELCGFPTLMIDDEGDEASLNTQFRTGRRSPVYNSILSLRDSLKCHAYIAYTATPQANLLISGIDDLSPDFGVLIQPGQSYCGGSLFFGPDRDRYVRVIPPEEVETDPASGIPEGLKRAIATLVVGGAIRHLREPLAWHSMLIHNSSLRVEHDRLKDSVKVLIGLWKGTLGLPDSDPAKVDLMVKLHGAYDDLCQTVNRPPTWEQVRQQLPSEVLLEVWMVNSLPLGRDPVGTPFRLVNNILVGGNMLGRGVTIPGLAVTYITRRAQQETNADTMEQRSRWFGYKESYLDVCRIFLTAQLIGDYTELLRHEDDFWDALSRNQRQRLSIRDWPRMLRLDPDLGLRPTRQNVASFKQFYGHGWDIQRRILTDQEIAQRNVKAVREFFISHPGQVQSYANTKHRLIQDCPTELVIKELLGRLQTEGTDWENSYTKEYLVRLLIGGLLQTIDVLLMSDGDTRVRSLATHPDGTEIPDQIENPMQGRTDGKHPDDREYYPGDENVHNGRPQLQVHLVQPRNRNLVTTILALYIPDDERYDLKYVVRDDVTR